MDRKKYWKERLTQYERCLAPHALVFSVGRVWAGHNIKRFDCPRIRDAYAEIVQVNFMFISNIPLLTHKFGKRAGDMKMSSLARYFGLGDQTHRSLDDARMTLEVLKSCATVSLLVMLIFSFPFREEDETGDSSRVVGDDDKRKGKSHKRIGVDEVYKQTREVMEKARMEREAALQAKREAKEEAESLRRVAKGKMMRKTRHGQPVMKYRIEHLLESIKKSAENDGSRTA
ncbi:BnaC03g73140D [Brassica napus]|uniref:BnaC03g73140D protein n=1 Tax=Brassica napus TaxID=3708 RepID=A0A078IUU0_BRANA|nr:BnaC03g73140D [Brassica napus]